MYISSDFAEHIHELFVHDECRCLLSEDVVREQAYQHHEYDHEHPFKYPGDLTPLTRYLQNNQHL